MKRQDLLLRLSHFLGNTLCQHRLLLQLQADFLCALLQAFNALRPLGDLLADAAETAALLGQLLLDSGNGLLVVFNRRTGNGNFTVFFLQLRL